MPPSVETGPGPDSTLWILDVLLSVWAWAMWILDVLLSVWAWANDKQTLAAGFLILIGVVGTLWFNAGVTRRQRAAELKHRLEALQKGLTAEMKIVYNAAYRNLDNSEITKKSMATEELATEEFTVSADRTGAFYKANQNNIGVLPLEQIEPVMMAYGSLQNTEVAFAAHGELDKSGRHYKVPATKIDMFISFDKQILELFKTAIEALNGTVEEPSDGRPESAP